MSHPGPVPAPPTAPDAMTPQDRFDSVADLFAAALVRLHLKGMLPPAPPRAATSKKGRAPS